MRDAALRAFEFGWNIIPVHAFKGPHSVLIDTGHYQVKEGRKVPAWKAFQDVPVTRELIEYWFDPKRGVPGMAAVTGAISNLVVLDFDGETGAALCRSWGLNPNALSGSGSPHVYFAHPGHRVPNAASGAYLSPPFPGLDVRGDGGMIVLPPSHLNNGLYRARHLQLLTPEALPENAAVWTKLIRREETDLPPLPEMPPQGDLDINAALEDALKRAAGGRDNAGYGLAQTLLGAGLSVPEAERVMLRYARCVPQHDSRGRADPYTDRDARRNLQSAAQRRSPGRGLARRTVRQGSDLDSKIRRCLPSLSLEERETLSRLLAATLIREGAAHPEATLRSFGLNPNTVQAIQTAMEENISVRGKPALLRFLEGRCN